MGTDDSARIWRHTSRPESSGSIRSRSTRSGVSPWNRSRALRPSAAWVTRNPSPSSASASVSRRVGSSSTTRIVFATPTSMPRSVNAELSAGGSRRLGSPLPDLVASAAAGGHVVLREGVAAAIGAKLEEPVVVVDPIYLGAGRVGPVGACAHRDGPIAVDGERPQVGLVRARRVAGAGIPVRVQPCEDDGLAALLGIVVRVPAVLGLVADQRPNVLADL